MLVTSRFPVTSIYLRLPCSHPRFLRRGLSQRTERSLVACRTQCGEDDLTCRYRRGDRESGGGARKQQRVGELNDEERERVAYHEVGHALVGAHSKHADPVHKISIVPRGRTALGYTLQLPTEQQFLMKQSELVDRLTGLSGGLRRGGNRLPRSQQRC